MKNIPINQIEKMFLNNGQPCYQFNGVTIDRLRNACEYGSSEDVSKMAELSKRFMSGNPIPYYTYSLAVEALERIEYRLSTRFAELDEEQPDRFIQIPTSGLWAGFILMCLAIINWKE